MEIELGPSSILHPLGKLSVSQELCFLPLDSELKEIFFWHRLVMDVYQAPHGQDGCG